MEFWHCIVFWKQSVYLAIMNQIFNRHSMPLGVRKMSGWIVKDCHRQTPKPVVWIHSLAITPQPKGASFSQRKRWMVSTGLKHNKSMPKNILSSKITFLSFHAVLWSMDNTQKMNFNTFKSSFKMTKKSLLVTFSIIFFLLFHLAIRRQRCPKKFRLDCKIGFQNMFYKKCINVIIDSIGPSIILRSIVIKWWTRGPDGPEALNWSL